MSDDFEADDFEADTGDDFEADDFEPDNADVGGYEKFARKALPITQRAIGTGLEYVGKASKALDDVTGRPIRAAVGALQEGKSLTDPYEYEKVPEWSEIYKRAGVSDEKTIPSPVILNPWKEEENNFSPADLAGGVTGAVMDPLNAMSLGTARPFSKAAGNMAEKGASKVARGLSNFAEERAAKTALGNNIKNYRSVAGTTTKGIPDTQRATDKIRAVGRTVLDDGSIGWLSRTEGVGEKSSQRFKELGGEFQRIQRDVDAAAPQGFMTMEGVADRIMQYADSIPQNESGKVIRDRLYREAENLLSAGPQKFGGAQNWKNAFPHNPQSPDAFVSSQDATNMIQRIIKEEMNNAVAATGAAPDYKDIKRQYGAHQKIASAATDRAMFDMKNRVLSPSDYGFGGATGLGTTAASLAGGGDPIQAMINGLIVGPALATSHKVVRERGSAFAAKTADGIRKLIAKNPAAFRPWGEALYKASIAGETSLAVTHQLLMNKDPEYRQEVMKSLQP